jgi:hypothetical protein
MLNNAEKNNKRVLNKIRKKDPKSFRKLIQFSHSSF